MLLALVAALGALTLPASGGSLVRPERAAPAHGCQQLGGKDLAPSRRIKLVSRPLPRGRGGGVDLVRCVLPHGALTTVAHRRDQEQDFTVRAVTGRWLVLETSDARVRMRTARINLLDGRSTRITYARTTRITRELGRLFLLADGQLAYTLVTQRSADDEGSRPPATVAVQVLPSGVLQSTQQYDQGPSTALPAHSLRLKHNRLSWQHSGRERAIRLPG